MTKNKIKDKYREEIDNDAVSETPTVQSLSGHGLLEAINQAELGPETNQDGVQESTEPGPPILADEHSIPLIPRLLSSPEIDTLMRSEAYRSWAHPDSEKVRNAVSQWFEITYPGPLNVDRSGRTIRTEDRHRPESAPKTLTKLGPLSLQRAKRLAPSKPSSKLTGSHRRYAQMIDERMTAWHQRQQAKNHFK